MRKIYSAPSLHGPRDLEYVERDQVLLDNEDSGLSVLHPKVKCSADESLLWDLKRHLEFMTLSYFQAGFSLDEMLHHISILKETQDACKPAILLTYANLPLTHFLNKRNASWNDESRHFRDENIDIHFAYPSCDSYSAAIETLRQISDFKVVSTQTFCRSRQGPALGIVRIQCDPSELTKVWATGQNAAYEFAKSILRLLKAGLRQAKFTNHYVNRSLRCGNTQTSTCELLQQTFRTIVNSSGTVGELQSEVFSRYFQCTPHQIGVSENCLVMSADELKLGHEIGLGSSGYVHAGVYREHLRVAVKILKILPRLHEDFRREIVALSLCRHRHVVPLVGACIDARLGICIVTKFMEGGSLRDYLQRKKKLQTKEALLLAANIAEGLHFLHSRGIIHMDLKTPNIFLDEEGTAVIGDLGSARFAHDSNEVRKDIGTYRWMAPEVLEDEAGHVTATPKSDVYSYGILLWELVTCEVPFAEYSPVQAAVGVMTTGLRPIIPRNCFPPLKYLIQKCWAQNPADRPSLSQIRKMLKIISAHPPDS